MAKKDEEVLNKPALKEATPTLEEAKLMFKDRPDLRYIITDQGTVDRDLNVVTA